MAQIPPLVDLCLYCVCKHLDGYDFLNTLPDFLRQRLCLLFKQEPLFQHHLENLNFSKCTTLSDEEVKSLTSLKNLKQLNVSHCDKLSAMALCHIGQLSTLTILKMSHCPKMSAGLYWVAQLTNVTRLEAAFCEIQDPLVPFLCSLPKLTFLNLMCNRLSDDGCMHLSHASSLTHLSLSMNPLITDKTLETFTTLTNLQSLNLNYCKLLTSEGISKLSKTLGSTLQQLDIIGCDRALNEVKTRPLILLAEDSKIQARMISMVLNRYNFDVEVATNGEMALELFRSNPKYDLILMDVLMPVMDGISCVKQIREYESARGLKRTPIIIQTADTRESQRTICLEAGCDEFLSKPLDRACISLAKALMEASSLV